MAWLGAAGAAGGASAGAGAGAAAGGAGTGAAATTAGTTAAEVGAGAGAGTAATTGTTAGATGAGSSSLSFTDKILNAAKDKVSNFKSDIKDPEYWKGQAKDYIKDKAENELEKSLNDDEDSE